MVAHESDRIAEIHRHLHSHLPSEPALRVKALESLLVEKGLVDPAAVDAWLETFREKIGPKQGARVVARAWCDADFKARLLSDATPAVAELGIEGWAAGHLRALENTAEVHNLVVCTLCSCYPVSLLGLPPAWYKAAAYRARAVREPRAVLTEFGTDLGAEIEVRVWDSTAELRYLVVPEQPAGTEGWDEARLVELVTRNSMIGTERDLSAAAG